MKIKNRFKKITPKKLKSAFKKYRKAWLHKQGILLTPHKSIKQNTKLFSDKVSKLIKNRFNKDVILEDLLGRKIFAKEISDKIDREHKEGRNVVLAISARWGSGKTKLLEYIEPQLHQRGFKVVTFNAWKYSQDPLSLKRTFLKTLKKGLGSWVNLDDLHYDTTKVGVNIGLVSVVLAILVLLILLPLFYDTFTSRELTAYFSSPESFVKKSLDSWNWFYSIWVQPYIFVKSIFAALLTIPLLAVVSKLFSFDQKSAKITETDGFEQKFNKIIGRNKKVVVFVDDLDRCTPDAVKNILDALTTFFEHERCSFIVTGDHTVIERYVGSQLFIEPEIDPSGQEDKKSLSDKQRAEGRRFLKKIFHVYWQLPEPDPNSFKKFTQIKVKESGIKLTKEQEKQIVALLTNFLDTNLREVIRFVDALMFTINTIKNMIEEKELVVKQLELDELEKKVAVRDVNNLKTVMLQPVLLAKTQLIQELFYPIYELHVQNPKDIILQEKALRGTKKLDNIFSKPIASYLRDTSPAKNQYIELIKSQPTFTGENNETKFDPDTFWYLSGVTGLPSSKGPDADRFLQLIKLPDSFLEIEKGLKEASPETILSLLDITKEFIKTVADPADKENSITNSTKLALSTEGWSGIAEFLRATLKEQSYINTVEATSRVKIMPGFFALCFKYNLETEIVFSDTDFTTDEMNSYKWNSLALIKTHLHSDVITKLADLLNTNITSSQVPVADSMANLKVIKEKVNPDDSTAKSKLNELYKKIIDWAYEQPDLEVFKTVMKTISELQVDGEIISHANLKEEQSLNLENWTSIKDRLPFIAGEIFNLYGRDQLNQHIKTYALKLIQQDQAVWHPIVSDLLEKNVITQDTGIDDITNKVLINLSNETELIRQTSADFLTSYHKLRNIQLAPSQVLTLVDIIKDEQNASVVINLLNVVNEYPATLTGQERQKNIIRKLAKSADASIAAIASTIAGNFPTRKKHAKNGSMQALEAVSNTTS